MDHSPDRSRVLTWARVDFRPKSSPPRLGRLALVTLLALIGSLAADAGLVRVAILWSPALRHYSHFRLSDYGSLTVIGVIVACSAWPLAIRVSSEPRRFFFRLAVVATLLLWVPDLWLLTKHEPTKAVLILMAMHLAIALITYNLLVFAAPARSESLASAASTTSAATASSAVGAATRSVGDDETSSSDDTETVGRRRLRLALLWGVVVEFVTGLVAVLYVPLNRPDGLIAHRGEGLYLVHAFVGGAIGIAAIAALMAIPRQNTKEWKLALIGGIGVALGALGGLLCIDLALRLPGMGLMMVGLSIAFMGYIAPSVNNSSSASAPPPGWNMQRDEQN